MLAVKNRERVYEYLEPTVPQIRDTAEISRSVVVGQSRLNHSVAVAQALFGMNIDLPIDPYTLGVWLGDGFSRYGKIGMLVDDIDDVLAHIPYAVVSRRVIGKPKHKRPFAIAVIEGLQKKLRAAGLLGNKRIPSIYQRASLEQRLELLRGMLDTDGHCDQRGRVEIAFSKRDLAEDLEELVCGLGIIATLKTKSLSERSAKWNDSHRLMFFSPFKAFNLARKAEIQKCGGFRSTVMRRYICSVTPVESVPTKCISVDSPSRTYLCTKRMIPTHNTDLMLGVAHQRHHSSIIFRREFTQLGDLIERSYNLLEGMGRFRASPHPLWRLNDGRRIMFSGVERESDVNKHKGRPRDFMGFDELTEFTEFQFRFLKAWNRTSKDGQRCRVICTFNPPTHAEGDWVIRYFAPWLDRRYHRPAKDGEVRWFAMLDGVDREVLNGRKFKWPLGHSDRVLKDGEKQEEIQPESRTFIRSRVEDNPFLMATGYKATLQALPEPYRSLMLQGRFDVSQQDHPNQVIPTAWVEAAQARWKKRPIAQVIAELEDIGVDVARGGLDKTVYALRCGNYVDDLIKHPGKATPDGQSIIRDLLILLGSAPASHVKIKIDAVGVGTSPVDLGRMFGLRVMPMFGGGKSVKRDKSKRLGFFNKRAEWAWGLREALDPASGEDIELPPSRSLMADLCSMRHELVPRGLKIEAKEDIKERIGRSPDEGEAVIYAFGTGLSVIVQGPLLLKASENPSRENPITGF